MGLADCGDIESYWPSCVLASEEQLRVHMDCLNSTGKVISIEDVDDLGGAYPTHPTPSLTVHYCLTIITMMMIALT